MVYKENALVLPHHAPLGKKNFAATKHYRALSMNALPLCFSDFTTIQPALSTGGVYPTRLTPSRVSASRTGTRN